MFVKKYEAPSLEQALARVKHELGPNALILSTQQKGGKWFQKSLVEVTAAFERRVREELEERFDDSELDSVFPHRRASPPAEERVPKTKPKAPEKTEVESRTEKKLRELVSTKSSPSPQVDPSRYEKDFLNRGFSAEASRELSRRLVFDFPTKELENPDFLAKTKAKLVASPLRTLPPSIFQSKHNWAVIGQPGAGKTTLVVKLAMYLQGLNEPVQLVSVDERKVMGRSELAAYAKLINVPFSHEAGAQSPGTKLQMVDTPSLNLISGEETSHLDKICRNRNTILVLDAGARLREMLRVVDACARFAPVALVFTRLDQVAEPGVIYDVLKQTKLPLLGLSMRAGLKKSVRFFESLDLANFLVGNLNKSIEN